jgi:MoxR-like ATPase
MPRPAGSLNLLQPIAVNGKVVKFPRAFLEALQKNNLTGKTVTKVIAKWHQEMAAAGMDDTYIHANRATIAQDGRVLAILKSSLTAVVTPQATSPVVDDEEDDEEVLDLEAEDGNGTHDLTNLTDDELEDLENDEQFGSGAATQTIGLTQAVVAPFTQEQEDAKALSEFRTDDTYFYGVRRQIPKSPLTPVLEAIYVNGVQDIAKVLAARAFATEAVPVMLKGEAGSGKSMTGKYWAYEMGLPFYQCNFDAHVEIDDLVGKYVPGPDGKMQFVDGPVTLALENGGVLALEELNMAKSAVVAFLREVLATKRLMVRTDAGNRVVVAKPGFRVVATQNPKDYAGTNEQSLAELDRFLMVDWEYPSAEREVDILKTNFPKIPVKLLRHLVDFANETRAIKANKPDTTRYVCSLRTLVKICKLITTCGATLRQAVDLCVLTVVKDIDPEEEYKAIKALVDGRFTTDASDMEHGDDEEPISL